MFGRFGAAVGALLVLALTPGAALSGTADGAPPPHAKSHESMNAHIGTTIDPATHPGRAIYAQHCAMCHEGTVAKAPSPHFLAMMAPDAVLAALNDGVMKQQGAMLASSERGLVAEYLTRTSLADYHPPAAPAACKSALIDFAHAQPPARAGWGHDNRRFVSADAAGLSGADVAALKLKWAFAFPASVRARSQPAIGWGTLFVGSQDGTVYAFELASGCLKWRTRVSAEVRTAIVLDPDQRRLYFGDLLGRVHAADAATGRLLWSIKADDHPSVTITGTPTLASGRLFVPVSSLEVVSAGDPKYACCTFQGSVLALDPASGAQLWRARTVPGAPAPHGTTTSGAQVLGPSGAPVWNSPSWDAGRGALYFGSGENFSSPADGNSDAVFAVDAASGARRWVTQLTTGDAWNVGCMIDNGNCPAEHGPDYDVAASVLLVPTAEYGDVLVAGQKSGLVFGLDPVTGQILWQVRLGHGGTQGGVHFGMAAEGQHVFVGINDMADTGDGRIYDPALRGAGLHALDAATGRVLWRALAQPRDCGGRDYCDPGISAAVTALPGVVIAGRLDGLLQAYDAANGKVIWSFDTLQQVSTITGKTAAGGAISGPGVAIGEGYLVTNTGYGMYKHMAGALLLVFGR